MPENEKLSVKETLDPKEELKKLMDQLNKLTSSTEGRRKLKKDLDKWVSDLLKKEGIVLKVKELYKELSSDKEKSSLAQLMKQAKVEDEVRDEQREINVRLEALKEAEEVKNTAREGETQLESEILSQLETKIYKLISQGDYQWALDNVVFLLSESKKDKQKSYKIVKEILKRAPSYITLYIKDKKISYSKRQEWIKKMDKNLDAAANEFEASYYTDITLDEWSLDESSKKYNEKKATRKLDEQISGNKELSKIWKHLNMPSAFKLINEYYSDIEAVFKNSLTKDSDLSREEAFNKDLDAEFFIKRGYIPKNWEDLTNGKDFEKLSNKELKALRDLCSYRMRTDLMKDDDEQIKDKHSYELLSSAQISWISMGELSQARNILDKVDLKKTTPKDALMVLFWDQNWDGAVTNTGREEWVDKEWVDKWTVFGWAFVRELEIALIRLWSEADLVSNIESLVQELYWVKEFVVDPRTLRGLVEAFKKNPVALLALRRKLKNEPDSMWYMFYQWADYADKKLDKLNKDESFRKKLESFFEGKEGAELLNKTYEELDKKMIDNLINKVRPNLIAFKENSEYANLNDYQKTEIDKLIDAFEDETKIKEFLARPEIRAMYKNFVISWIWFNFSDVNVDGDNIIWGGAWASISNEKFNEWLSKSGIINDAKASVWLYCADWQVSLGLWLGLWASRNINENARAFYHAWGSWSPFDPKWLSFSAVVWSESRIQRDKDDAIDASASHYVWVAGAYGLWLNLSDSDFKTHNVSLNLYWRQDKLEWVEKNANMIKERMAPIFAHLFETDTPDWKVTPESILKSLRSGVTREGKQFSWFPSTSWDSLLKTATAIYDIFNSYKGKLADEKYDWNKNAIIEEISNKFADSFARQLRNQNIEKIIDEWVHISWASLWISVSFARLFTWFFLSWGVSFTWYEDSKYKENEASLQKAIKWMENPNNYDSIRNEKENYEGKMDIINNILRGDYLKYTPEVEWEKTIPASITLSKDIFSKEKGVKVMCHPVLAEYIKQEDWEIKLPWNADVSLSNILHQWKSEYTLILGANSSAKCWYVELGEDWNLEWVAESDVKFGSKSEKFDTYNTTFETKYVKQEVVLDWAPSKTLLDYLQEPKWSEALVKFRNTPERVKFVKFILANPDRWWKEPDKFIKQAMDLLPASLKIKDVEYSVDDIRFIYASLSRVSQTLDKQLDKDGLVNQANTYLENIKKWISGDDYNFLNECINNKLKNAANWEILSEEDWKRVASILKVPLDSNWHMTPSNTPERKLFHILTPIKKLADKRTHSYERRIDSEYKKIGKEWGAKVLKEARKDALNQLNNKLTAKGTLWDTTKDWWWIWSVAWYDSRDQIDDKFISSPKVIEGSDVLIKVKNPEDKDELAAFRDVKYHYLDELSQTDKAQFSHFKEKILDALKDSKAEDDQQFYNEIKSKEGTDFINAILNRTTTDKNNNTVPKVSFDMRFAFFADCVNETILLWNVKVSTTVENKIQPDHDVHYMSALVTSDWFTTWHSVSFWVTVGEVESNPLEKPDEPEEPKEPTKPTEWPTGNTEPFSDLDALSGATEVDFANKTIVIDGVTYQVRNAKVEGHDCVVAFIPKTNEKFVVVPDWSGGATLVPYTSSWSWILNNNVQSVDLTERWNTYYKELAEYKVKKDIYDVAKWKFDLDNKAYQERYDDIIKLLPYEKQSAAREIVDLNYRILISKPGESSELRRQREEKAKQINSRLVDKLLQ